MSPDPAVHNVPGRPYLMKEKWEPFEKGTQVLEKVKQKPDLWDLLHYMDVSSGCFPEHESGLTLASKSCNT